MKANGKLTVLFEFNVYGRLKGLYFSSENEEDQRILERGLNDLLKPQKFSGLKKLFQRFRQ